MHSSAEPVQLPDDKCRRRECLRESPAIRTDERPSGPSDAEVLKSSGRWDSSRLSYPSRSQRWLCQDEPLGLRPVQRIRAAPPFEQGESSLPQLHSLGLTEQLFAWECQMLHLPSRVSRCGCGGSWGGLRHSLRISRSNARPWVGAYPGGVVLS